jgi:peptidoglycan/LPS O-acetylase OafA/YrhL
MTKTVLSRNGTALTSPLLWVDLMKAVALCWVFLNHIAERLFGYPYIANPSAGWPPFSERLAQLRPLSGHGLWDVPLSLFRYIGWFGDQGVQLFLIVSGFGLTWGLLKRYGGAFPSIGNFYLRRLERIYPLWWGAHLMLLLPLVVTGRSSFDAPSFVLSMIGVRATLGLLYYITPIWWYIGLLIQLYLIYPFLWGLLRRYGPLWLLIVVGGFALVIRGFGLIYFHDYLDAWSRGAIFITRLPEFVLGIALAAWLHNSPTLTEDWLRARLTPFLALVVYAMGTVFSLSLQGMAVAPFLLGASAFSLLYILLSRMSRSPGTTTAVMKWVGEHSYSLFLLHGISVSLLIPKGLEVGTSRIASGVVGAVLLTIAVAMGLEWAVETAVALLKRWYKQIGLVRITVRFAVFALAFFSVLLSIEFLIRSIDPQEVLGWGERPSLEPHPRFGWRLKPSRETRLRWEHYDYRVVSNSLGFPGPEYAIEKKPSTLRIMTTGDAFTSAEGVDTDQAWPRLLEKDLAASLPNHGVEVLNFAVTGYGPNQYAAVIDSFGPIYKPDMIIIEFFVNDYADVLMSNEEFQKSIGFDLPASDSWYSVLRLSDTQHFVRLELWEPAIEWLLKKPRPHGYFLGNFSALDRNRSDLIVEGRQRVAERLAEIKAVADRLGASLIVVMVPAPVQVCGANELSYYPRYVNLCDSTTFDLDLPQRMTQEICDSLGASYIDLRPCLRSVTEGPVYQPRNMHWTVVGHRAVSRYLATILTRNGPLRTWTKP